MNLKEWGRSPKKITNLPIGVWCKRCGKKLKGTITHKCKGEIVWR